METDTPLKLKQNEPLDLAALEAKGFGPSTAHVALEKRPRLAREAKLDEAGEAPLLLDVKAFVIHLSRHLTSEEWSQVKEAVEGDGQN